MKRHERGHFRGRELWASYLETNRAGVALGSSRDLLQVNAAKFATLIKTATNEAYCVHIGCAA